MQKHERIRWVGPSEFARQTDPLGYWLIKLQPYQRFLQIRRCVWCINVQAMDLRPVIKGLLLSENDAKKEWLRK